MTRIHSDDGPGGSMIGGYSVGLGSLSELVTGVVAGGLSVEEARFHRR